MILLKHITPGTGLLKVELSRPMDVGLGLSLLVENREFSHPSECSVPVFHLFVLSHWFSNELHASVSGYPNNIYRCCESAEEGQRALDKYLSKSEKTVPRRATPDPLVQSQPLVTKSDASPPAKNPDSNIPSTTENPDSSTPSPAEKIVPDSPSPAERLVPDSPPPAERPIPDAPKDESWWCCFAGADPGVYMGLYVMILPRLRQLSFDTHRRENLRKACPAPGGVRRVNSEEDGWNMWTTFFNDGQVRVVHHK